MNRREHILVDGHSLLHRMPACAAAHRAGRLYEARRRLVERLERVAGAIGGQVTVVFDGRADGGPSVEESGGPVEVVFSPARLSADAVIERRVAAAARPGQILVVTSDRLERETVDAAGADTMSCGDFLAWCHTVEERLSERCAPGRAGGNAGRHPALGDALGRALDGI